MWSTRLKNWVNGMLTPVNLRVETMTADRREAHRLDHLKLRGYFAGPVFPVPGSFFKMDIRPLVESLDRWHKELARLQSPPLNDFGFSYQNSQFQSPDAEVMYTMIRLSRPNHIIEVGCGNSTRVICQALLDEGIDTDLVAIDPEPRVKVESLVGRLHRCAVETISFEEFDRLGDGDILSIDSSHQVKTGNDVTFLLLRVLPRLKTGVILHVHDIFLPYDYPEDWVLERRWGLNEQYLVQALLAETISFDVLWAGHWLQRSHRNFRSFFPHIRDGQASSLWLRKTSGSIDRDGIR